MLIHYKIQYWDEAFDNDNNPRTEWGLTFGENLGEGVNKVVDYYGKENCCVIEVYDCEDVLSEEEIKDFDKE